MIRFEDVSHEYAPGRPALQGLSFEVAAGELLVLVGGSGSGKTTTLELVNRLVTPTGGRVLVNGRDVAHLDASELRRSIGTVFQRFCLFPHWTVGENVGLVPKLLGWSRTETSQRVEELLELVGLPAAEFLRRFPRELSGGQQQRVGMARALAARPPLLLMDEAFGALDPVTRDRLRADFHAIHRSLGLTTLFVTHDVAEALLIADRIAVLHEGELLQLDTPSALVARPADPRVTALVDTPRRQAEALANLGTSA